LKKWRGELGIACWQQAGNQVCSLFTIFDWFGHISEPSSYTSNMQARVANGLGTLDGDIGQCKDGRGESPILYSDWSYCKDNHIVFRLMKHDIPECGFNCFSQKVLLYCIFCVIC
jgi:hypothetical protein